MSSPATTIRLGTRRSRLAQRQAQWVADRLQQLGLAVELVLIVTHGDRTRGPIGAAGSQGLFTREIQRALLAGRIDLAVHSLKDLPTAGVEGLVLVAVPPREPAGDVLVSNNYPSLDALPEGAVIGSGSMRRRAQLLHARPDLRIKPLRGNVDTRLRRLDQGECDALILAEAGLVRLGLQERITARLPTSVMLPAPGQGALGLEVRADEHAVRRLIEQLDDPATHRAVVAERSVMASLGAGCLAPLGALAAVEEGRLKLTARVLSPDGQQCLEASEHAAPGNVYELGAAQELGRRVARQLLDQGADKLIQAARRGQK